MYIIELVGEELNDCNPPMASLYRLGDRLRLAIFSSVILSALPMGAYAQVFEPNSPASSGFKLIFDDEFTTKSTIDCNNTGNPGYNWYVNRFDYPMLDCASVYSLAEGTGPLVINPTDLSGVLLTSVGQSAKAPGFVGSVFGAPMAGQPTTGYNYYYFEVSLAFDNMLIENYTPDTGWPSFWGVSIQTLAQHPWLAQWPGQPAGYDHHIESDFFEFLENGLGTNGGPAAGRYSSGLIDWYGMPGAPHIAGSQGNTRVQLPSSPTWSNFNRIGQLWVRGTSGNNYQGFILNYFNGTGAQSEASWWTTTPGQAGVSWTGPGGVSPEGLKVPGSWSSISPPPLTTCDPSCWEGGAPDPSTPWTFSIIDSQDINLMIGAALNQPLAIRYIRVWARY